MNLPRRLTLLLVVALLLQVVMPPAILNSNEPFHPSALAGSSGASTSAFDSPLPTPQATSPSTPMPSDLAVQQLPQPSSTVEAVAITQQTQGNPSSFTVSSGLTGTRVIATIPVGHAPSGVGVNPDTNRIYVSNRLSNTVSVIDGISNTVIFTVPLDGSPWYQIGVNSTTNRVYVSNNIPVSAITNTCTGTLSVIDGNTYQVTNITLPYDFYSGYDVRPEGVAVHTGLNRIYVAHAGRKLAVIDGATNAFLPLRYTTYSNHVIAINEQTDLAYVSKTTSTYFGGSNSVAVVDLADYPQDFDDISIGGHPAVNEKTNRVYLAQYNAPAISVIDGATNNSLATISLASKPRLIAVNPATNRIYVTHSDTDKVTIIDGATNVVVGSMSVGLDPVGIAVNNVTGLIYVANESDNTVSVIQDVPGIRPDAGYSKSECPVCGNSERQNYAGDPINTYSGNFNYQVTDLSAPGLGQPLRFERTYNSLSVVSSNIISQPLGYGWVSNYDARLIFPSDPGGEDSTIIFKAAHGSQLRFRWNGSTYEPSPGVWATLQKSLTSPVVYTMTAPQQETYVFTATGQLITSHDSQGQPTSYTYDISNTLTRVTDVGSGRWLALGYDGHGRLASVTDHGGRSVGYGYDGNGDLAVVTDTRHLTWTYTYSGSHLLNTIVDPDGYIVERVFYDDQARATRQEDGSGNPLIQINYGVDNTQRLITGRDVLTDTYDSLGLLVGQANAQSNNLSYAFDAAYNRTGLADANGNPTSLERTPLGLTTAITDAAGYTTTMQYDELNNLKLITDTRGFTTTYSYSGTFLTGKSDAYGNTWIYTPTNDGRNLLAAELAPGGRLTEYQYDPFGQRTVMTDALQNVTRYEYDPVGRLITTTDAIGRITVNAYDPADHLIAVTNNFTTASAQQNFSSTWNLITRYGYDGFGRQIAVTDTLNHITRNYFDGAGRLISVTANFTTAGGVDPNVYNLKTWYGYDAVGNQIAVTDTLLHVTFTEFDNLNRPVTVTQNYKGNGIFDPSKPDENVKWITHTDPAGNVLEQIDSPNANGEHRVTRNWYDSLNRVISTTDNFTTVPSADPNTYNLTTWYEYDPAGNQVAITDTQHHVTRNYYDPIGRPISTTVNFTTAGGPNFLNQYNLITRYEYDGVGNRVAITDPLTSTIRYTYDKLNRVIATTNVSGTTTIKYDAFGHRVAVTDALTHTTVYTYNTVGQLIAEGNPVAGNITRYEYDVLGRTVIVTDALTHPTRTFYDAAGRVVSTTNALTGTTVITYNALGQQVSYRNENGKTSYTAYDGLGRTIVVTDATGGVTSFSYDAVGNRTVVTDALTHPMTSTYDVANRLIQMQDALGNTTRYGYDSLSKRVVMTDANGIATGYGYDALNRLSVVTESMTSTLGLDPSQYNLITRYDYDALSNRVAMTDALTHTTVYTYDALSRLIAMSDPLTHTTRYQYDALGNRIKVIDANNQTTIYTYDVLNRNTQIDYGASLVKFEYDPVGNRKAMTDSLGVTRYLYDALNRPISITDALTGTVQYRYDDVGNRIKTIYPDGKIVTATFDAANRLTQTLSWDGQVTQYAFDKAGRLITTTLPNGIQSINAYDVAGRLVNLTHQGPYWLLATYTYTLDAIGNRLAVQERVLPPTPFVYLPLIMKDDGGEQMMAPPGQISPFVSPLPVPAPFQSPLPTPTTTGSAGIPASPIADLALLVMTPTVVAALVGRRQKGRKWTLPLAVLAGTLITVGLTQTSGAAPGPMPFLSPTGNPPPGCTLPTAIGDTRVISYTYDPLYRLTNAAYSSGECYQYAYDRVGNRTTMTTSISTTTYQYDPANRLSNAGSITYTWDNNGNLINDGAALYRYDSANRLISTTLNSATSLYAYNGEGVRLKQVVAGAVTTYTQDLAAPLPIVLQSKTGMTTTKYLYATGTRPLAQNATAWEYLLLDALGNVRQIANVNGYIIRTQDYEPYGGLLNSSGSGASAYGFTGEERDTSGLVFLRARYMQPKLGMFLSRDPWSGDQMRPGSMNGYSYVEGDPINEADPTGQWALDWGGKHGNIWAVRESNDNWNSLFRALGIPREAVPYSDLGPVPRRFKLDLFVDPLIKATAEVGQGVTLTPPETVGNSVNCFPTALSCAGGRCAYAWLGNYDEAESFLLVNAQLVHENDVRYRDIFRIGGYNGNDENYPFHYGLVLLRSEQSGTIWTFNGAPAPPLDSWGPGYRIATLNDVVEHFDYFARNGVLGGIAGIFHNHPAVRTIDGQLNMFYRLNMTEDIIRAMRDTMSSLEIHDEK